jgi:pullulanase
VPYYYFRTNDRGQVLNESGVGNALHDERPMVRKYIRESLEFWTREYRLDGFRFDLMGMFTPESIKDFASAIRRINPDAVIYGEPWTGGGPNRSPKGTQRNTGAAVFNDRFRGVFRGGLDSAQPGFGMGGTFHPGSMWNAISGGIDDFTASPLETVNYVSAHDNLTLRDKIKLSMPTATKEMQEASVRFALAATMLSQGVPFIEGGVELGRTKGGNNNSYNAGDAVNEYRWDLAAPYQETVEYLKGLIAFRKAQPTLRLSDPKRVRESITVLPTTLASQNLFAYSVAGKNPLVIAMNGNQTSRRFQLPSGKWELISDGKSFSTTPITVSGELSISPLSVVILMKAR